MAVEFDLLGWPADGPTLRLDHREFAYAGKFVMSSTGKAVAREGSSGGGRPEEGATEDVVAAVAFDADRTDPDRLRLRYVTVRRDRQGEGLGPALVAFVVDRAGERGYDRVAIAVNNPYAYEALYRAGFEYTGERTGIAELVLERSVSGTAPPDPARYRSGLGAFAERDLDEELRGFVERKREAGPPDPTGPDGGADDPS